MLQDQVAIQSKKPYFKITLDTRRMNSDGKFPVKLRVTFNRKRRYYSIGIRDLTKKEWATMEAYSKNPRVKLDEDLKELVEGNIPEKERYAVSVGEKIVPFSFERFKENYFMSDEKVSDVFSALDKYIKELEKQKRFGTASSYGCANESLKTFQKVKYRRTDLPFNEVTKNWLDEYKEWMLESGKNGKGNSETTVGIYLRALRIMLNEARELGVITQAEYPFGRSKSKFSIGSSRNVKKAIKKESIKLIQNYKCSEENFEGQARDYWLFSYLLAGMNMKDLMSLKYENIEGNSVYYRRKKTRSTKREGKFIKVTLTPEAKAIIDRRGNKDRSPENYVFPILDSKNTPEEEFSKSIAFTHKVNKYMKRIGEKLGIPVKLTTYVGRHSFTTIMSKEVPTEVIQQWLGHGDVKTTEGYKDSIQVDEYDPAFNALL